MSTPKTPVTLRKAVDAYLATLERPETVRAYAKALGPLAEHFGPDTALEAVDPDDVAAWLEERWGKTAPGTRNLRLASVRAASAWWMKRPRRWITLSLADGIERARAEDTLPTEVLSPAEMKALIAQCSRRGPSGIRNRALIMMLYRSGLRLGEALAFRPGDIDHDSDPPSIQLLATKSRKAQVRYYDASAEPDLLRWLDTRKARGINGHHPVFCTLNGDPLSQPYVRATLHRYAESAGIVKRVHPHAFRKTFALELEAAGVPLDEIQGLLGHGSLAVTFRYLRKGSNRDAGRALSAATLPDVSG